MNTDNQPPSRKAPMILAVVAVVFQIAGLAFTVFFWLTCRNQPDMGGALVYGCIAMPTIGASLLVSTAFAYWASRSSPRFKAFRNRTIGINVTLILTAYLAAGQL